MLKSTLYGTLVIIPATFLDAAELELEFWRYPVQLIPIAPKAMAFDLSMIPVAFMLIYQYFISRKSFIIAFLLTAVIYAFNGEPYSTYLGLVQYVKWKYIYSFLYYVILGLIVRWLIWINYQQCCSRHIYQVFHFLAILLFIKSLLAYIFSLTLIHN
ncbi:CBO0543 family protein [Cytobacillus praedii]|uniref:CBO0543 family protein n=1 Tax=Cytobacillus praedii TaxID=1742358 RepID=UPI003AF8AD7F